MNLEKLKTSPRLEQILLNFIDVLRINIMVVDSKGNTVLSPKTGAYGFHGSAQWGVLQYLGTPEFLSKFQSEGLYLKSIDIFGFQTFAIPIPLGDLDDIGYLIVGPVILNRHLEESLYRSIAKEIDLNYIDFLDSLSEIRVVTFNSLKSMLDLLFELSRYALRMNHIEVKQPVVVNDQLQLTHSNFTNLLDLSMDLAQAECGSIMLFNKFTKELSVQVFKGIDLHDLQDVPVKLGEGIAGLAVQERKSFVLNGNNSNNRIRHLLKKPELKCALVLPIINNKEVIGVMNISSHLATSRLATHSKQVLKSLSEITSGVLISFS